MGFWDGITQNPSTVYEKRINALITRPTGTDYIIAEWPAGNRRTSKVARLKAWEGILCNMQALQDLEDLIKTSPNRGSLLHKTEDIFKAFVTQEAAKGLSWTATIAKVGHSSIPVKTWTSGELVSNIWPYIGVEGNNLQSSANIVSLCRQYTTLLERGATLAKDTATTKIYIQDLAYFYGTLQAQADLMDSPAAREAAGRSFFERALEDTDGGRKLRDAATAIGESVVDAPNVIADSAGKIASAIGNVAGEAGGNLISGFLGKLNVFGFLALAIVAIVLYRKL